MFFLPLLLGIAAYGQIDTSRIKYVELPDSTEIGTPLGEATNKEIGPKGGSIRSADGRLEFIFPSGALDQNTVISILPVTNFAPNGTGVAYQCEPSGIRFRKPVEVAFHYSDEEAEVCPPDLMGFAQQDHTGKWSILDYNGWDSLNKTLKGSIEHFSEYANQNKLQLVPRKYELQVGDTLTLHVCFRKNYVSEPRLDTNEVANWFVNNRLNGGGEYGIINPFFPQWHYAYAQYFPPNVLPSKNVITIQLQVLISQNNKATVKTFTSRIILFDEYKVLITDTVESRVGEGTFVADSGTFIARVTPSAINVTNVRNYPPYSFVKHKPPFGKIDILIKEDCKGSVNIGISKPNGEQISYSQASFIETDKPRKVLITFDVAENLAFRYHYQLRGANMPIEMMPMVSVPSLVSFYVNGEPQKYQIDANAVSPYTIYVRRNQHESFHFPRQ